MRKKLIAGNWKMHGNKQQIKLLIEDIISGSKNITNELVVFPPFIFLAQVAELLQGTNIHYGAQTVSQYPQGAYTGEISADMLKDLGCRYVLIGHSERRCLFGETNTVVVEKYQAAVANGLIPIVCVGETLSEHESNRTEVVVAEQVRAILALKPSQDQFMIAYEPIWAIGTGKTATPDQAQAVHAFIRQQVFDYDKMIAENIRILYGGSVKPDNAIALFNETDIDGGLIGGASLKANAFLDIAK